MAIRARAVQHKKHGDPVVVMLYDGRKKIGGSRAERVLQLRKCRQQADELSAQGHVAGISYVVTHAFLDEEQQGKRLGLYLYTMLFDEILAREKEPFYVGPFKCMMGMGTSSMAGRGLG